MLDGRTVGAELVTAVDDVDLGGELREVDALLDGGVAAADDRDLLALVESPVADDAEADALFSFPLPKTTAFL